MNQVRWPALHKKEGVLIHRLICVLDALVINPSTRHRHADLIPIYFAARLAM